MVCPLTAWGQDVWDGTTKDESWYDASKDEFTISTAAELAGLAKLVNDGNDFEGKTIYLDSDITLNENVLNEKGELNDASNLKQWTAIGTEYNYHYFSGTFDGQNHTISGIYIDNDDSHQGLFGLVADGNMIQNLSVAGSYIKARNYVGGIVGENGSKGEISNCSFSGTVTGTGNNAYVGGIVGGNYDSEVSNCTNNGTVTGTGNSAYVGGIVGLSNYGTVSNCTNSGTVTGTDDWADVGGIVGWNYYGTVSNCYYLDSSCDKGIGDDDNNQEENVKSKTEKEYASGEVAYLLGEAWGQKLDGKSFPVPLGCLSEAEREACKIYSVTFTYKETPDAEDGTEVIQYGNNGMAITAPTVTSVEGYTFAWDKEVPTQFGTENIVITGTFTKDEEPTDPEEPEEPETPVIPDMPDYYNIMVEECEGVTVETSTSVVREGQSMTFTVDIAEGYTDENMTVKVKRSLFGYTEVIEPNNEGSYEVKNIYTDIYLTVDGVEEEEEEAPTGMEELEGAKVYAKEGSIYVQTPTQEQVQIISISGAVLKNETQIGLHRYDLPRGIYIICIGEQRFKVRN